LAVEETVEQHNELELYRFYHTNR